MPVLEAEAIPQSVKRKIIQEYLAATMPARRRRLWNFGLTAALLLVTTLGAASFLDLLVLARKPHRDSIDSRKGRRFHRQQTSG